MKCTSHPDCRENRFGKAAGQAGVTVVETCVILSLLFLILFGILETSILLFNKAVLNNACREAARFATMFDIDTSNDFRYSPKTDAEITQKAGDYATAHLINFSSSSSAPSVTITPDWATRQDGASGNVLQVNVSYNFQFLLLPNLATSALGATTLTAQANMRQE